MCGLFGFAGRLTREKRRTLLKALAVYNVSRGHDSTGLAIIDRERQFVNIYKETSAAPIAVNEKGFIRVSDDIGQVWIGHTRAATRGAVTVDNAHPYHIGRVVGAHNGVIHVDDQLKARCGGVDYPVDSQYLIHLLNKDREIGEISGYAAVVYTHLKEAADVTFIRDGSPLTTAVLDRNEGIAWSSDSDHLRHALSIAGIRGYKIVGLKDDQRYDVYLREDGRLGDVQEMPVGITHKYRYNNYRTGNHYRQTQQNGCYYDYDYTASGGYNSGNQSAATTTRPQQVRRRKGVVVSPSGNLHSLPVRTVSPSGKVGEQRQLLLPPRADDDIITADEMELARNLGLELGHIAHDGSPTVLGDALKRLAEEQEREIEEDAIRRAQRVDHEQYGYALTSDDMDVPSDDDTVLDGELAGFGDDVDLHSSKLPRELRN